MIRLLSKLFLKFSINTRIMNLEFKINEEMYIVRNRNSNRHKRKTRNVSTNDHSLESESEENGRKSGEKSRSDASSGNYKVGFHAGNKSISTVNEFPSAFANYYFRRTVKNRIVSSDADKFVRKKNHSYFFYTGLEIHIYKSSMKFSLHVFRYVRRALFDLSSAFVFLGFSSIFHWIFTRE